MSKRTFWGGISYGRKYPQIAGIIIGNHSTKMLVFSDSEILEEGTKTIVERYESLQLGIAVTSVQLFDIEFKLLNGTLYNHLSKCSLIGVPIM